VTVGSQLAIRVLVTTKLGIDATGHFQAAWNLSMLYLGFVLGAMATDYYPRLTAVARDAAAANEMMNEQAEVALLLSAPVILAMLTLTPWIIAFFYSQAFAETTAVLRWQILGDVFKVASWSLGFLLLAQARSALFFITELAGNLVYVACVWYGLGTWGLEATGIAYLICYIFSFFFIWLLVRSLIGFTWKKSTFRLLMILATCSVVVFLSRSVGGYVFLAIGVSVTLAVGIYSFFRIWNSLRGLAFIKDTDLVGPCEGTLRQRRMSNKADSSENQTAFNFFK